MAKVYSYSKGKEIRWESMNVNINLLAWLRGTVELLLGL